VNPTDPAPEARPARARAWFLVGPTASGKTDAAHELAAALGARIVSADALQVYRGLDVGTAKPSPDARRRFGYVGLDLADPDRTFSVGDYLRAAGGALADAGGAGAGPWIVVGGSGLYVRCLLEGLAPAPEVPAAVRAAVERRLAAEGVGAVAEELRRRAPAAWEGLRDRSNPRRVGRALELALAGAAAPRDGWRAAEAGPRIAGLRPEPAELERRIAARVAAMYAAGLVEEARALRERHGALSRTAAQAIGYREAWDALDGRGTPEEAARRTVVRTRQLARRQMTWFRHQARVDWIDVAGGMSVGEVARRVREQWEQHGPVELAVG
jgi:tRNA dimethylallyltransferase